MAKNLLSQSEGQSGFTLIELMIVMTVSLIGLAGVMSIFTSLTKANKISQEYNEAIELAEEVVEQMRGFSVAEIEAIPSFGPITTTGWGPVPYLLDNENNQTLANGVLLVGRTEYLREITAEQTPASDTLVRFLVEVSWGEKGLNITQQGIDPDAIRTIRLEFLKTRQGGL